MSDQLTPEQRRAIRRIYWQSLLHGFTFGAWGRRWTAEEIREELWGEKPDGR